MLAELAAEYACLEVVAESSVRQTFTRLTLDTLEHNIPLKQTKLRSPFHIHKKTI